MNAMICYLEKYMECVLCIGTGESQEPIPFHGSLKPQCFI